MTNRRRAVVPLIATALVALGTSGVVQITVAWQTVERTREIALPGGLPDPGGNRAVAVTTLLGAGLAITVVYGLLRCTQALLEPPEAPDRSERD